jgi:hypothetical protein
VVSEVKRPPGSRSGLKIVGTSRKLYIQVYPFFKAETMGVVIGTCVKYLGGLNLI